MLGKIKFLDNKTQKWGFIVPDDGTRDVHFSASDFDGDKPRAGDQGRDVEFELEEDDTRASRPSCHDTGHDGH
jgi:cold shock CspA family protein